MDIADTSELNLRYEQSESAASICKRCGSSVGDLTQHEEFHAKLNQMWGAAGLPLYATEV